MQTETLQRLVLPEQAQHLGFAAAKRWQGKPKLFQTTQAIKPTSQRPRPAQRLREAIIEPGPSLIEAMDPRVCSQPLASKADPRQVHNDEYHTRRNGSSRYGNIQQLNKRVTAASRIKARQQWAGHIHKKKTNLINGDN